VSRSEIAEQLEAFFRSLGWSKLGRTLLAGSKGSFHLRIGNDLGLLLEPQSDWIKVRPAEVDVAEAPTLTRLAVSGENVILELIGRTVSYSDMVIPIRGDVGHILILDNWMVRKSEVSRLGQMVRIAQEAWGAPRATGDEQSHTNASRIASPAVGLGRKTE
jgi:hypothetical protein